MLQWHTLLLNLFISSILINLYHVEGKPVVTNIDSNTLTNEQKERELDAVNIIELKRDRKIKGRTCSNRSKQKMFTTEYESGSITYRVNPGACDMSSFRMKILNVHQCHIKRR